MTDAESIAADLRKSGQAMTLTRSTSGAYDPVTGVTSGAVVQSWTVHGITANYTRLNMGSSFADPGTMVMSGDKKAIISAEVEPLVGDTLTIMGIVWQVIALTTLSPQGVDLLYTLQVRK